MTREQQISVAAGSDIYSKNLFIEGAEWSDRSIKRVLELSLDDKEKIQKLIELLSNKKGDK